MDTDLSKTGDQDKKPEEKEEEGISFKKFLEDTPPNQKKWILDLTIRDGEPHIFSKNTRVIQKYCINTPRIYIHCSSEDCDGLRYFDYLNIFLNDVNNSLKPSKIKPSIQKEQNVFFKYFCSNCNSNFKTFALNCQKDEDSLSGYCLKFGEKPPYGPPSPSRLIELIGPDRELFLKGRRCEMQGLGKGAFAYYRQVVEDQKNRILDEIIKVAAKVNTNEGMIKILENAKTETQFSKAIENIKDALPPTLLIENDNPLTLLHSALSKGLHSKSDEECLTYANSIRLILVELSERLGQVLKDKEELNEAIKTVKNT